MLLTSGNRGRYGIVVVTGARARQFAISGKDLRNLNASENDVPPGVTRAEWEKGCAVVLGRSTDFFRRTMPMHIRRSHIIRRCYARGLIAAAAFDSGTSTSSAAGVASLTFSHTASGANRACFVGAGSSSGGGGAALSSVTYGGVSLTQSWAPASFGTFWHHDGWILASAQPATGAQNVVATWPFPLDEVGAGCITATGIDIAGTPFGTSATASGSSSTASVSVASASGDLVVSSMYSGWSGLATPAGGATQAYEELFNNNTLEGQYLLASGTSTTMSCTQTSASSNTNDWGIGGIAMKAAGGGGGTTIYTRKPMDSPIFISRVIR